MADETFECPGCGRSLRSRDHRPFWYEARARTEGRQEPTQKPTDNDSCRLCGGPLPKSRRRRKDKVADLPTVLAVEEADLPTVLPADEDDCIRARPVAGPSRRKRREDARAGLYEAPDVEPAPSPLVSPFLWTLLGVGAASLVLLPLALFFFIPAMLLAIMGLGIALAGFIWSCQYYSRHDYDRLSGSILALGGAIARWINYALNALQDPLGIGRPFLLHAIGLVLLAIGLPLSLQHYKNHSVITTRTHSSPSAFPNHPAPRNQIPVWPSRGGHPPRFAPRLHTHYQP